MILEKETVQRHLDTVWKGWKIAGILGHGTYGSVYEIYRNDLENEKIGKTMTSALKVLYMESMESSGTDSGLRMKRQSSLNTRPGDHLYLNEVSNTMLDDFVNSVSAEIRTMVSLKGHPNVVSIEDYHVSRDDHSCLIMIRMEKLNCLSKAIREGVQAMSGENVIRLGIDICRALESCERQNIIHRDIKPSNLFFGEKTGFKLGDFGISRTMEHVYMSASMSGAGTPQYMAPEVYTGRAYNNKADIYSLGIVLYQLMNDSFLPFLREYQENPGSGTRREIWMRRMRGEKLPAPVRADPRLASVILRACSYQPEERFNTAGEFREALESCLGAWNPAAGTANTAAPVSTSRKAEKQDKVTQWIKIAIAILTVALFFTIGLFLGGRFGKKTADSSEKPITEEVTAGTGETGSPAVNADTGEAGSTSESANAGGTAASAVTAGTGGTGSPSIIAGAGETGSPEVDTGTTGTTSNTTAEGPYDPNEELTFADPALEKAIRASLGLADDEPITRRIALRTKKLMLGGGGKEDSDKISDLTGLSAFANLEELDMPTNNISNIDELAELGKLQKLMLEKNKISDLTPLSNLSSLRSLEIAHNQIEDLSPIYTLDRLELLDVIHNKIDSIKGIGSMRKLHTLRMGRNQITDITPVGELQDLTDLSFGQNQVEDISILYELPMLKVLTFNNNQVRDISPVLYMEELFWLEVKGNPIEDESVFDNLPESITHLEK